jgi:hypothetical protein
MKTRRRFLVTAPLGLLAVTSTSFADKSESPPPVAPPGAPPTFGTSPPVGPEVAPVTFAEAEKLMQVTMTDAQRQMAAQSWSTSMAGMLERRTGPHKVMLEPELAPATQWNPVLPGMQAGPKQSRFVRSKAEAVPLPTRDEDIAFAPVTQLSRWIEA